MKIVKNLYRLKKKFFHLFFTWEKNNDILGRLCFVCTFYGNLCKSGSWIRYLNEETTYFFKLYSFNGFLNIFFFDFWGIFQMKLLVVSLKHDLWRTLAIKCSKFCTEKFTYSVQNLAMVFDAKLWFKVLKFKP